MRIQLICAVLAATAIAGCQEAPQKVWPWQNNVPVTRPLPQAPQVVIAASAPADTPADETAVQTQPQSVGDMGEHGDLAHSAGQSPQDQPATMEVEELISAPLPKPHKLGDKPEVIAQSVLQINDQFITVEDVLVGARQRLAELPRAASVETFRKQAQPVVLEEIRDQVNQHLVGIEASGRLSEQQKEEVDKEMAQVQREMLVKAGGSKAKLEQMVLKEGITLERMLKDYRRRLESQIFLRQKFAPAIFVNRRILWDHYQSHLDEFTTPKKVQMQTISVLAKSFLPEGRASEQELAAAKKQAADQIEQAHAQLQADKPFETVAGKFSMDSRADDGGLWPLMPQGSFRVSLVEAAAFEMSQGQTSRIIPDGNDFYIVKAAKVVEGQVLSFEEAQVKIEDHLRRQQYRKLSEEYYQKLVKKAVIVQAEDFVDRCLDRAAERYHNKN